MPECKTCAHLGRIRHQRADTLPVEFKWWRCELGHFDFQVPDGASLPQSYAWSGICRPNKAVAQVQKQCRDYRRADGLDLYSRGIRKRR